MTTYRTGNYMVKIDKSGATIESTTHNTNLGALKDNAIIYPNGKVAFDYPELIPEYVKVLIRNHAQKFTH